MSLKHRNLDELLQPALAPLGPAFTIIDSLVALSRVFTELQGALAKVPPDFPRAVEALKKAGAVPGNLAKLMPATAVPLLLSGCVNAVLRVLKQARSQMLQLRDEMAALAQVESTAQRLGDTRLMQVFECAQHNVQREAANVGKGLASVGHILGIIELLSRAAGHELAVPDTRQVGGKELQSAIAPLDALIAAIEALPVPR